MPPKLNVSTVGKSSGSSPSQRSTKPQLSSTKSKRDATDGTSKGVKSLKQTLDNRSPSSFKPKTKRKIGKDANEPKLDTEEDFDWENAGGGWTVDKWVESLRLHQVVAMALEVPEDCVAYEHTKTLTREQVSTRLRNPQVIEGLVDALMVGVDELQMKVAATGAELNKKFALEGGQFEMAFGSLDLFFGGLDGLIGPPQMIDGSLQKAMRAEHCDAKDAKKQFTSSNGVETKSEIEWEFVVEPDLTKEYPDRIHFKAVAAKIAEAKALAEQMAQSDSATGAEIAAK